MYDAASEERNNATEATSSALPILFKGVVFEYCLIKFESCFNFKPATCPLFLNSQNKYISVYIPGFAFFFFKRN